MKIAQRFVDYVFGVFERQVIARLDRTMNRIVDGLGYICLKIANMDSV